LLALGLVRCEGESSFVLPAVDAGVPNAQYEAVCSAWARSRCACTGFLEWVDSSQCIARETIDCELLAADPNVPFDAARVAACPEPDEGGCFAGYDEYCIGAGRGGLGDPCLRSEACASGYCAQGFDPVSGATSLCGTCQLFPCKGGCPSRMSCLIDPSGSASCVPSVGLPGDRCAGPNDCDPLSYCAPTGMCTALPTVGEACGDAAMGLPCGGGDEYCDPKTNTCAEYTIVPVGYGERCGLIGLIDSVCVGWGRCDPTEGICLAPASDGALCDDKQELGCLPPAQCIGNHCLFPSLALCGGGGAH
jgi:hypothetical protein